MLKSILIITLLIPFLLITFPIVLLTYAIGKVHPRTRFKIAKALAAFASYVFFIISGAQVIVKGKENIPSPQKGMLFVGNHKSYIDIALLLKYVKFPIAFIAKSSLKKIPLLNTMMSLLGCLFLERENVRQAVEIIKKGIKKLERAESLVIFPEGTRSKIEGFLPFKQGSLKLAEKAHVLVIPLAIKGTDDVFGKHGLRTNAGKIWLTFGAPIDLAQLSDEDKKKSATYVQNIIQGMYDEMHD